MGTDPDDSADQIDKRYDIVDSSTPPTVHKDEYMDQHGSGAVVVLILMGALATIVVILSVIVSQFPRLIDYLFS